MDKVQPITRRAALLGALISSTAIAVPLATLMPAPAAAAVSDAVQAAASNFAEACIASARADEAANVARRAKSEALRRESFRIRYSYAAPSPWERVEDMAPPYFHRRNLAEQFNDRLVAARDRAAEAASSTDPKVWALARFLPTEAAVMADRTKTMAEANKVFRRYRRVERAHDDEPAWAAAAAALDAMWDARKVLIRLVLDGVTAEETAVISAAFVRAGQEGGWGKLPTLALLAALAGDRETAERWT